MPVDLVIGTGADHGIALAQVRIAEHADAGTKAQPLQRIRKLIGAPHPRRMLGCPEQDRAAFVVFLVLGHVERVSGGNLPALRQRAFQFGVEPLAGLKLRHALHIGGAIAGDDDLPLRFIIHVDVVLLDVEHRKGRLQCTSVEVTLDAALEVAAGGRLVRKADLRGILVPLADRHDVLHRLEDFGVAGIGRPIGRDVVGDGRVRHELADRLAPEILVAAVAPTDNHLDRIGDMHAQRAPEAVTARDPAVFAIDAAPFAIAAPGRYFGRSRLGVAIIGQVIVNRHAGDTANRVGRIGVAARPVRADGNVVLPAEQGELALQIGVRHRLVGIAVRHPAHEETAGDCRIGIDADAIIAIKLVGIDFAAGEVDGQVPVGAEIVAGLGEILQGLRLVIGPFGHPRIPLRQDRQILRRAEAARTPCQCAFIFLRVQIVIAQARR